MVRGLVGLFQRFWVTGVLFDGGQEGLVLVGYCNLISGMWRNSIHCSNDIFKSAPLHSLPKRYLPTCPSHGWHPRFVAH
jgi:hypothetical protein